MRIGALSGVAAIVVSAVMLAGVMPAAADDTEADASASVAAAAVAGAGDSTPAEEPAAEEDPPSAPPAVESAPPPAGEPAPPPAPAAPVEEPDPAAGPEEAAPGGGTEEAAPAETAPAPPADPNAAAGGGDPQPAESAVDAVPANDEATDAGSAPVAENAPGAEPAVQNPNEQVCDGLDSGRIEVTGSPTTLEIVAPEGMLIRAYCVKAGSAVQGDGPVYVVLDEPVSSVVISHPSGKALSHYSVDYVPIVPCPEQTSPDDEQCSEPVVDLAIEKTHTGVPGGTVDAGETFEYLLTVTNEGDLAVTNGVVTDTVPDTLTVVDVTVPMGWVDESSGNMIMVSSVALAAGAWAQIVVEVTVDPGGSGDIVNTACVDLPADSFPGNDCDDDTVTREPEPEPAELTVVKSASRSNVVPGESFTYALVGTNVSDTAAEPVVLTDVIPDVLRVDGISTNTAVSPHWEDCDVTGEDAEGFGGTLECTLSAALMAGASAPAITLSVTVHEDAEAGTVENVAEICWGDIVSEGEIADCDEDAATVRVRKPQLSPEPPPDTPVTPPAPAQGPSAPQPLAATGVEVSPLPLMFGAGALLLGLALVLMRRGKGVRAD